MIHYIFQQDQPFPIRPVRDEEVGHPARVPSPGQLCAQRARYRPRQPLQSAAEPGGGAAWPVRQPQGGATSAHQR